MSTEIPDERERDAAQAVPSSFRKLAHEFRNVLSVIVGDLDYLRDELAKLEPAPQGSVLECVANLQQAAHRAVELAVPLVTLAKAGAGEEPEETTERPPVKAPPPMEPTRDHYAVPAADARPDQAEEGDEWSQRPTVPGNALSLVELARRTAPADRAAVDPKHDSGKHPVSRGGSARSGEEGSGAALARLGGAGAMVAGETPAKPLARGGAAVGSTILVVEDVESERRNMGRLLEQLGYQVVAVPDGREAVRVFREEQHGVGLVLLDLVIPGLSGRETFRALRKIDPHVRVLLVSGYVDEKRADELLGEGAAGFLQKPVALETLRRAVATALGGVRPVQKPDSP